MAKVDQLPGRWRRPPPTTARSKLETDQYYLKLKYMLLTVYCSSVSRQVDMNSKNVFGQPRLRASLRDLRSPRRTYKSTIEDDLKKLIIMDNPGETPEREPVRITNGITCLTSEEIL